MNDDLALTVDQLERMPRGAVVVDHWGRPWTKRRGRWVSYLPVLEHSSLVLVITYQPLRVPAVVW